MNTNTNTNKNKKMIKFLRTMQGRPLMTWTDEIQRERQKETEKRQKLEAKQEMALLLAQLAEDPSSANPLLAGPNDNPAG
jgi:hypothetical protein